MSIRDLLEKDELHFILKQLGDEMMGKKEVVDFCNTLTEAFNRLEELEKSDPEHKFIIETVAMTEEIRSKMTISTNGVGFQIKLKDE